MVACMTAAYHCGALGWRVLTAQLQVAQRKTDTPRIVSIVVVIATRIAWIGK